jgi:hypothetical protein
MFEFDNLNVGLVGVAGQVKGLGEIEKFLNKPRGTRVRKLGKRGIEICASLCKTEAFRGWKSPADLSAYEDYVLTQFVISRGYAWIKVDSDKLDHVIDWVKVRNNRLWAGRNAYRMFPSRGERVFGVFKLLGNCLVFSFKFLVGQEKDLSKYRVKQNLFFAVGVLCSLVNPVTGRLEERRRIIEEIKEMDRYGINV